MAAGLPAKRLDLMDNVGIVVEDIDAAIEFFTELGLELGESPARQEPPATAAERIAYGVLVAALEEGLVSTLQHAMEVLTRFSAPGGPLGEQWLREQEKKLR